MPLGSPEIKNRKAFHDYHIIEKMNAGLVLTGTEIKSIREGRASLRDSHVVFERNEAYVIGLAISQYANRGYKDHHPHRPKKLLLHKRELKKLFRRSESKGMTIVPLKLYFNDRGYAKLEIALAEGKRQYDKRKTIADRDAKRDMARVQKEMQR